MPTDQPEMSAIQARDHIVTAVIVRTWNEFPRITNKEVAVRVLDHQLVKALVAFTSKPIPVAILDKLISKNAPAERIRRGPKQKINQNS